MTYKQLVLKYLEENEHIGGLTCQQLTFKIRKFRGKESIYLSSSISSLLNKLCKEGKIEISQDLLGVRNGNIYKLIKNKTNL